MLCDHKTPVLYLGTNLVVFLVLVFCLGPQLGCLDADGDGVPEVPVVVSSAATAVRALKMSRSEFESATIPLKSVSSFYSAKSGKPAYKRPAATFSFSSTRQSAPLRC